MMLQVDWDKQTVIPAVAQDEQTGEVLMLAYMNEEALALTLETGYAHYYSRSRKKLWKKGESSGHFQKVSDLLLDCDGDTVVLKIEQIGGIACHTGRKSCFYTSLMEQKVVADPIKNESDIYGIVDSVYHVIEERKRAKGKDSYVASLFKKGENAILKKVVEEAGELSFAVKDNDEEEIIYEATDLLFHTLVALSYKNVHPERIRDELSRRFGLSGIEEKNSRSG
jgi:phosphoribosyl-ATP pyrophosphohydrolase/phosphoribosyl-AMP cyclohydrolase